MMLFRSARFDDLEAIYQLSIQSGVGITTLPKDKETVKKRLSLAVDSFKRNVSAPEDEYYWFVLEELDTGQVVGTSAIQASVGYHEPVYSYKVSKRTRKCPSLKVQSTYELLSLVNDYQGHSEICTLYLNPAYRLNSNGLLLSRARFLFIGQFPARFSQTIIAEMRGVSDEEGHSPFWDNVMSHFFPISFVEADKLSLSTDKQFISNLMPRNPIYVKLLATAAQEVIGKPHPSTVPAMHILLREGFRYNQYVDIFDAGPTIEAPRDAIRTIVSSRVLTVKNILDDVHSKRFIIANTKMDFRAIVNHVVFNEQQNTCILSHNAAEGLQVKRGDSVRIAPLHME